MFGRQLIIYVGIIFLQPTIIRKNKHLIGIFAKTQLRKKRLVVLKLETVSWINVHKIAGSYHT